MKNVMHLLIAIALVLWSGGCDGTKPSKDSGRIIKIGIIAPLTGPDSTKGIEGLKGMETGMTLQPYLQNGDRIKLIRENDRNDPALTVKSLQKLVEEDNVSVIMTFSGSSPVLALAQIADAYKTPILAAIATNPDTTKDNVFVSQLCFDDHFQGTVAAMYVRDELLIDKVAVFRDPASAYSSYLASIFETKFNAVGGEVTDSIFLGEKTANLFETIKSVHSKDPGLLYLPIRSEDVIRIAEELRRQGWKPMIMGSDGLISTMIEKHKEQLGLVEGLLATDFFANDMPLTSFGKKARDKHRDPKTTYAALGVEGYALLVDALNRCGDPEDRECVNNQIRATTNFTGIAGKITIGANGKAERPLCICAIDGGLATFIVKVY